MSSWGRKGKGALWGPFHPFIRALIPFARAPPSCPNDLPKAPLPNTSTLGIRFQCVNFRGTQIFSLQKVASYSLLPTRLKLDLITGEFRQAKRSMANEVFGVGPNLMTVVLIRRNLGTDRYRGKTA